MDKTQLLVGKGKIWLIATSQEKEGVDSVLNAAALTYVASAAGAVLQLVYWIGLARD